MPNPPHVHPRDRAGAAAPGRGRAPEPAHEPDGEDVRARVAGVPLGELHLDSDATRRALDVLTEGLLSGPRELTAAQVAAVAGVREDEVWAFWNAFGLRLPAPDEPAFAASDAHVIGGFITAAGRVGLTAASGVSLIRAMGHSVERMVTWQSEALVEHLVTKYGLRDADARRMLVDRLREIHPLLEIGVVHSWRRHLAAVACRLAAEAETPRPDGDELPLARAVGLADMVGFTARTAGLGAAALADFIQGFETRARDVVTSSGGRVVKTIGDALLFVTDDAQAGASVALGLGEQFGPESETPLRIGLVWGRVLSKFGDVFGPSIALASRLCDIAGPGRVLVDEATAALLEPQFLLDALEVRDLPGIGPVRPSLLIAAQ